MSNLDALRIDRSQARTRQNRPAWLKPLLLLAFLALAFAGWKLFGPKPTPVETTIALEQTAPSSASPANQPTLLNASGYITARLASTVSSKITGKVTEVFIEEGMEVKKDQILAKLDDTNTVTSLNLAEAKLISAQQALEEIKPNLEFAEKELVRFTDLVATKAASQSDLNRVQAEVSALHARLAKAAADITVAEREVQSWQQQVEDYIIRAPFSGIVTQKNAQPGEMISPMSAGGGFTRTGICTIVDMNSLEIDVDVNESFINRVHPDQPVEAILDSYPNWTIPAKVIAIIPTADRQKATVKVRVAIDLPEHDPRILPDMGVKVAFKPAPTKPDTNPSSPLTETTPRPIIIPQTALRSDSGQDIVWIVHDGRAQKRNVTVSQTNRDQTHISAGIVSGETVIINPPSSLTDGSRVVEKNS